MLLGYFNIEIATQEILLGSNLKSISDVDELLSELKDEYSISDEMYSDIWVVLHEAVTNAIRHGNNNDTSKKVRFTIEMKFERYLSFTVKDEGAGFDPCSVPDPTAPERIEEPNGRGIFLIKTLSDKVKWSQNGSCLEMCFDLFKN